MEWTILFPSQHFAVIYAPNLHLENRRMQRFKFGTTFAVGLVGAILLGASGARATECGRTPRFEGQVHTRWEDDGRHMILLAPYSYVDASCTKWTAPKGTMVDGASIPRAAWTFIGGPFEGKYRGPSVLHDWYCDRRLKTWQETDRMFLAAMLTAGVPNLTAQLMFAAVWKFGPRWDLQAVHNEQLRADASRILERYRSERLMASAVSARGQALLGYLDHHTHDISQTPPDPEFSAVRLTPQSRQALSKAYSNLLNDSDSDGQPDRAFPRTNSTDAAFAILAGDASLVQGGTVATIAMPKATPEPTEADIEKLQTLIANRELTEPELEALAESSATTN